MPSPAFITDADTFRASRAGAPASGWRMAMKSIFIASSVLPVSMSVSPFCTELDAAAMLTSCAPRYLPANSNDVRVRVLFS